METDEPDRPQGHPRDRAEQRAVGPDDLRSASPANDDPGVVLMFGWYTRKRIDGKQVYVRNGGHAVALAGYDAIKSDVFYVSNPLTDYSDVNVRYSKIAMRRLPADVKAPDNVAWYTNDLVGGNLAILELMLSVLPRQ